MEKENPVSLAIPFENLDLDQRHIQKMMGYKDQEAPEPFPSLIGEAILRSQEICEIRAGYVIIDHLHFRPDTKSMVINNFLDKPLEFFVERIVFSQLKRADKIIVFLCTAGDAIGEWSKKLMNSGDMLMGYVVDVIGSEIVEAAMDLVQKDLETYFKKNDLNITNRYSPGYCNWQVSEQQNLFRLLPANFCGIRLSSSSLMKPQKSISGFIGLGQHVKRSAYQCKICDIEDCIYRNVRT